MQRPLSIFHGVIHRSYRFLLLLISILALSGGVVLSIATPSLTYAATAKPTAACSGTTSTKPDSNSLLVVLLDRSGSLGFNNGGTDPDNYSASVTDALSDLWPGPMAVIPFYSKGDKLITTPIGPLPPGQRDTLKNTVDNLPSNGWTPLAEAMQEAQSVLTQHGTPPAGSEIVVITDGQPQTPADQDGSKFEEPQVLNKYAPMFCQEHVPVNPIGLTIPENSNPARFLLQVATASGGSYQRVSNANELAGAVIGLYAAWDELEFNHIQKDQAHDYYPIVTDSSVQSAYILTFYQSGKNDQLTTTSGITPQYTSTSDGRHYEIDTLLTPGAAATYTVRTADPNAVVYDLVKSTRALQIVSPVPGADAFTDESIAIQAQFFDQGQGPFVPNDNGQPFFQATVIETVHGHALPPVTIDLTRQQPGSARFVGSFAVPPDAKPGKTPVQIGTLQIKVVGTYQGVEHTANPLTIPVVIPQAPPPPPPPPCQAGFWQCAPPPVHVLVFSFVGLLLLLLIFLFLWLLWYRQPAIYGSLTKVQTNIDSLENIDPPVRRPTPVYLNGSLSKRKKIDRLRYRSRITSDELRKISGGQLTFNLARLEFIAKRGNALQNGKAGGKGTIMYVQPMADNKINDIKVEVGGEEFPLVKGKPLPLRSGTIIVVNGAKARYF